MLSATDGLLARSMGFVIGVVGSRLVSYRAPHARDGADVAERCAQRFIDAYGGP